MKYIVTLNGKQFEVEVERGQANAVYMGEATAPIVQASTTPAACKNSYTICCPFYVNRRRRGSICTDAGYYFGQCTAPMDKQ